MASPSAKRRIDEAARGLLGLARRASALKAVARTGWLDRGLAPAAIESVADHSYGVALLAWACAIERHADGAAIDPQRVMALALLHDLAEAETGDAPPYDPHSVPGIDDPEIRRQFLERRHRRDEPRAAEKRAAEEAVMRRLSAALPAAAGAVVADLWDELRQGTSAEARFVKQVDRLETFLQSRDYLSGNPGLPVSSFQQEVAETIDDPLLSAIRDAALGEDVHETP